MGSEDGWRPGGVVDGYRLGAPLGRGGMGQVFQAVHLESGAVRAVKTLLPGAEPEELLRFAREGEAQARVDTHPAVARIHGVGRAHGRPFIVLELCGGGSLAQRLARGRLPWRAAAELVRTLAGGVAHLHARGVLHRDLKPENVLFDDEGRPRLVDFGLARLAGAASLTATGTVLGTPAYLSPEQASGLPADRPSDVHALGLLLLACLGGASPFARGALATTLSAVMLEPAPRPSALDPSAPAALDRLIEACLAKEPARRPTAGALEAGLGAALAEASGRPRAGRRAALAVALTLGGAAAAVALRPRAVEPPPSPPPSPPPPPTSSVVPIASAPVAPTASPSGPLAALRAAAEANDPASMLALGLALRRGQGGAQDLAGGERWLRQAASAGHAPARRELLGLVALGQLPGDPDQALADLVALGDPRSLYLAGRARRLGPEQLRDERLSFALLQEAASSGDLDAMVSVARDLVAGRGELPADVAEGVEWLELAAKAEHGPALHELAGLAGARRDVARARELYQRARAALEEPASRNEPEPALLLGLLLRDGLGGPRRHDEAARLLRGAALAGAGPAADEALARTILAAPGVAADPDEARRALERAMAAGRATAAWLLYELHREGRLPQDDARAWAVLLVAARGVQDAMVESKRAARAHPDPAALRARLESALAAGEVAAAYPLAWLLDGGLGGPADAAGADRLLRQAADARLPQAVGDLAFRLWPRADPAAVEEAVRLFQWLAERGASAGMHLLGQAREQGRGAPQDLAEAARWYQLSFERGNAWAAPDHARLLHEGLGRARDDEAALEVIAQAVPMLERALAGNEGSSARVALHGCARVGRAIGAARGDPRLELRFLRLGARHGDAEAAELLRQR